MSQILELKKTPEGKFLARRKDGKPLTPADRAAAKRLADGLAITPTPDLTEGRIIAVEICSNILAAHIWLAFDDSFNPGDGQAVFYADELEFLKTKDAQTLREIHKMKVAFSGSRVGQ